MAPVRANGRGIFDVQLMSIAMVCPGPTGRGRATEITVRSSVFPSSGAMNLTALVKSTGANDAPETLRLEMSIAPKSAAGRLSPPGHQSDSLASCIHVESAFRHALKYK